MTTPEAVVVGSGPNGLAAAIVLAEAGISTLVLEGYKTIGGGLRTAPLTLPGFQHDVCAAFHPLGAVSPFFSQLPLKPLGMEWIVPEVQVAHPLQGDQAAGLWKSLDDTVDQLGPDGATWRRLVSPLVKHAHQLGPRLLGPLQRKPWGLLPGMLSVGRITRRFQTPAARALLGGICAHAMAPPRSPAGGLTGLALAALSHVGGWPLIKGGTATLAESLAAYLRSKGGIIETERPVRKITDLPKARAVLFDTHPVTLAEIYGKQIPKRATRPSGPAVYKVDFALAGPIPWTAPLCAKAGTVHLGGVLEDTLATQTAVATGKMPKRLFVLVGQQSLFDSSRAPDGYHTAWTYTHVPGGYIDPTRQNGPPLADLIESRIEEYAPGFRDLVLARRVTDPQALATYNPNYQGGDIGTGRLTLPRLLGLAGPYLNPYRTGLPNTYLCSAAAPPGPGVHGMCGVRAAQLALKECFQ